MSFLFACLFVFALIIKLELKSEVTKIRKLLNILERSGGGRGQELY